MFTKNIKKIMALAMGAVVMVPAGAAMAATPADKGEDVVVAESTTAPSYEPSEEQKKDIVHSLFIDTKGIGKVGQGKVPVMNAVQAKLMARRAAMVDVVARACKDAGASKGAISEFLKEEFDGKTYTIYATVQVWQ